MVRISSLLGACSGFQLHYRLLKDCYGCAYLEPASLRLVVRFMAGAEPALSFPRENHDQHGVAVRWQ